tara:strand:- start:214 stop:666 length:453 start_codon:yes stop_codon:yes gene_type:complete
MFIKLNNDVAQDYTIGQLRKDNPSTSFPRTITEELLAEYDVYPAVHGAMPSYDEATQRVTQNAAATEVDGVWTYGYTVEALTDEEVAAVLAQKASGARSTRDSKLAETDWYALSDVTMSAEMTAYRQGLRDISSHANFPNLEDSDWPVAP